MIRKIYLCIFVLCVLCMSGVSEDTPFPDRFFRQMVAWLKQQPQEKVYLHTDRDHYEAGDQVWLRAYLLTSFTHQPSPLSRYIYVELRDRQDSLYARVKLCVRDSIFSGYLPLSERLAQGDYFLRAYSSWMQNAGDDYIFRKKIRVLNPRDTKVQTEISTEVNGSEQIARIRFFNSRREPYEKVWVEYVLDGKMKSIRTNEKGEIHVKLDTFAYGKKVEVRFRDNYPFTYSRYLYLPDPSGDFDVKFMPEGGDLLEGCRQVVAFKAIGREGLSREITGYITNSRGEQVAFVQTLHKGMGAFELDVETGQRYDGVFTSAEGVEKRFSLPEARTDGVGLKLQSTADMLGYTVLSSRHAAVDEDLYLVGHMRGIPLLGQAVRPGARGKIAVRSLPEGIFHFLLINSRGEVLSQRLAFIRHPRRPEITVKTRRTDYQPREQVGLDIQVVADSLQSLKGSFSLAVTDDSQVEQDSLQGHILSYLLLTSDLKGYIEEPACYFKSNSVITRRYLDLLMLTQGWTRFDVEKIFRGEQDSTTYYVERGQVISGKVKNFWGKKAEHAQLILLSTNGLFQMVEADTSGHFLIDGIAFPDSTRFMLQGRSKKGRRSVEVIVDKEEFLSPVVHEPVDVNEKRKTDDFYKRFSRDYYYDHGIKVHVLDEAVVMRKVAPKTYSFYDPMADHRLDSMQLAGMQNMDMRQVLQEFPGVDPWGDSVTRFGKPIYLLVNDFEESWQNILLLQPQDLVSISFIRPPLSTTFWGSKAEHGAIVMTTNPHFVPRNIPKLNLVGFSLLGYQKKAEFYIPRYEVDSVRMALADVPDLRRTIYWNPHITTDESGRADCFFTTSDSNGPYTLIIEGLLENGTVCRKEQKIWLGQP